MNFLDWYTDTVDIYRVSDTKEGSLSRKERSLVQKGVKCRVYRERSHNLTLPQTAAETRTVSLLACANEVDVRAGDELIIHRGGAIGHNETYRAFASDPNHYYEPFGAVIPGLAHQEIQLLSEERI